MSLHDRSVPEELSALERELLFNREDTGFVSRQGQDAARFHLDPSPFLRSGRPEIYCCEGREPPPAGALVEVSVASARKERIRGRSGCSTLTVKYVDDWRMHDPATFMTGLPGRFSSEFVAFFADPLRGEEDAVRRVALSSALYALSSPPEAGRVGGVNTAFVGRDGAWRSFRRMMQIIPDEFTRAGSRFFYRISGKDRLVPSPASDEISLALQHPKVTCMHLPLSYGTLAVPEEAGIARYIRERAPAMRPHLLDALLLSPALPERLSGRVIECVYAINDELRTHPRIPCRFDIDAVIPRLGRSIARLHAEHRVTGGMLSSVLRLFLDNLSVGVKANPSPLLLSEAYRLSIHAWKLYLTLADRFGTDSPASMAEVMAEPLFRDPRSRNALRDLQYAGYVIRPKQDHYVVLDLGNAYKNRF